MGSTKMTGLERTIGRAFRNRKFLLTALTHPSYQNSIEAKPPRNPTGFGTAQSLNRSDSRAKPSADQFQRFEFLGDSIINYFVATNLYEQFPNADEGLLSRLRSILVSRKLLARLGRSIRLRSYLNLGERERKLPEALKEKMVSDAFEALVAALYFDRGKKAVEQFLMKCFAPYFNQKRLFAFDPNPKSALQEEVQKKFGVLPAYHAQLGKSKDVFTAWVTIKGRMKTKGRGRTKQEAEAQAAAALLKKLKAKSLKSSSAKGIAQEGSGRRLKAPGPI